MTKILVPTDFSENSLNALDYAVDLINQLGGYLLLYHVYQVPMSTGSLISIERFIKKDAEKEIEEIYQRVKPQLKKNVEMETRVSRGHAVQLISKIAENPECSLVVVGAQGRSALKDVFLGSIAAGVMKSTTTPVLAIPHGYKFKPLKKIVLAMDDDPISNISVVKMLKDIVKSFIATLNVYHLEEAEVETGIDSSVGEFLQEMNYSHLKLQKDSNINEAINDYLDKENADMLSMIRRERGFIKNFLHPSLTRREVFSSQIPLLILHD